MNTKLLREDEMQVAVALLKTGEPVAIPTETVYGLAAPLFDEQAIGKIFSLKGRPSDNPLIAHVSSISMVSQVAGEIPPLFHLLVDRFWPGPLTLVLPKKKNVPLIATGGQMTIGVRFPAHPIAAFLIEAVGPLVAPSANLSGRPSPTCAQHVLDDFEGKLAAVVDGGVCNLGIESTVLSLVHARPMILRPGVISKEEIEAVLGQRVDLAKKGGPLLSPGMKYRHYAPKAPISIVSDLREVEGGFLLSREKIPGYIHRSLQPRTLYAWLREADRAKVERIWVLLDPISSANEGLMNRLLTAAG